MSKPRRSRGKRGQLSTHEMRPPMGGSQRSAKRRLARDYLNHVAKGERALEAEMARREGRAVPRRLEEGPALHLFKAIK